MLTGREPEDLLCLAEDVTETIKNWPVMWLFSVQTRASWDPSVLLWATLFTT